MSSLAIIYSWNWITMRVFILQPWPCCCMHSLVRILCRLSIWNKVINDRFEIECICMFLGQKFNHIIYALSDPLNFFLLYVNLVSKVHPLYCHATSPTGHSTDHHQPFTYPMTSTHVFVPIFCTPLPPWRTTSWPLMSGMMWSFTASSMPWRTSESLKIQFYSLNSLGTFPCMRFICIYVRLKNSVANEEVIYAVWFIHRNGNLKTLLSVGGWNFGSTGCDNRQVSAHLKQKQRRSAF